MLLKIISDGPPEKVNSAEELVKAGFEFKMTWGFNTLLFYKDGKHYWYDQRADKSLVLRNIT